MEEEEFGRRSKKLEDIDGADKLKLTKTFLPTVKHHKKKTSFILFNKISQAAAGTDRLKLFEHLQFLKYN